MTDRSQALVVLRARAQTIRDALSNAKIEPDSLTAMALVYNAMKLLKLPADSLLDGPMALSLQAIVGRLEQEAAGPNVDATDPNAPITITQAQLAQFLSSKVGNA